MSDDCGGYAGDKTVAAKGFRHHGAGGDCHVVAQGDAAENDGAGSNPAVVAYDNGSGIRSAEISLGIIVEIGIASIFPVGGV